jgi:hypothetical protein
MRRIAGLLLLAILLALIVWPLVQAGAVWRAVVRLQGDRGMPWLSGGEGGLSPAAARTLRQDLTALERALRGLYGATAWWMRPLARQSRAAGLASRAALLDAGLAAAIDLTHAAGGVAARLEEAPSAEGLGMAWEAVVEQREDLLRARENLVRLDLALQGLGEGSALARRWGPLVAQAPLALDGLLIAGEALAGKQPRTYLLLLQNSDELRATGGFISSVAVIRLAGGRVTEVSYHNSYDIEAYRAIHPAPPAPLRRYMGAGILLFRDGNWSPDFPTSAEVLGALYQMDAPSPTGESVDGVIALDTPGVQLLLEAIGPLELREYGVTITAENVVETAVDFWERPLGASSITERQADGGEWLAHRKDFGGAVLRAGMTRLEQLTAEDGRRLLEGMPELVRGKHLLAWPLEGERSQADVRRAGLDGGVQDASGDYLMVVDSNVGWNKADRHLERRVDYQVTLGPGGPQATLRLTYRHYATARLETCEHRSTYLDSYEALTQQCYWNYVRVLVPRGSLLREVAGSEYPVDEGLESGKACWGTLLVVPPGEERTLTLTYALPLDTLQAGDGGRRAYHLLVQKQPGTESTALSVAVELVTEGVLVAGEPLGPEPWDYVGGNRVSSTLPLAHDVAYAVDWQVP